MTPYYDQGGITIYHGDAREIVPEIEAQLAIVDPPYGETALHWDSRVSWPKLLRASVRQAWVFGSLRSLVREWGPLADAKFRHSQEIVWEKQNGSGFHADRFRRVHEIAALFYRGPWSECPHNPVYTDDATKRTIRRKTKPTHCAPIGSQTYVSIDGGPRMARSVQRIRNEHGRAVHPTQKPVALVDLLLRYSAGQDDLVLDPFSGSGTTLVAARRLGRRAIGIEIEERYCALAVERLAQHALDFSAEGSL